MSYRVEPGETAAHGIRRIVLEQLERALLESADPEGPKAAHAVRKRIKKIRAVLRLVKREIGSEVYGEENQRLRKVAHAFAGLRDAVVQREVLEKLRESAGLEAGAFAVTSNLFRTHLHNAAASGHDQRAAAIGALVSLGDRLEGWPLDHLTVKDLCCAFGKTYRKARKCFHYVLGHRSAETLHSWRKRTKRVWYQSRLLLPLRSTVICEIADGADTLGGYLGDLHDLAFLREQLTSAGDLPADEREVISGLICLRENSLERTALDLGCRFYAEKPGAFRRRLLHYAEEWPEPPPA